jgi:hypothetical protein
MTKTKKNIKVRDLKPKKDAKGGGGSKPPTISGGGPTISGGGPTISGGGPTISGGGTSGVS